MAVGRAQNRYLFLMLTFGLLSLAVVDAIRKEAEKTSGEGVDVPLSVLGVPLGAEVVLALSPFVLLTLILGVFGTFASLKKTQQAIEKIDPDAKWENTDHRPNLIDLVVFDWGKSAWRSILAAFSYPAVVTAFYAVSLYLIWVGWKADTALTRWTVWLAGALALLVIRPLVYFIAGRARLAWNMSVNRFRSWRKRRSGK